MKHHPWRAFTIIELLVVVSIIALLVGILLPAIQRARDQAKQAISTTNLKNLGTAHANYAAEWSDRQFTLADDNLATYGSSGASAIAGYDAAHGSAGTASWHPPPILGWGHSGGGYIFYRYFQDPGAPSAGGNSVFIQPIVFSGSGLGGFGSFRLPNVRQFNQYVSGRFYDKIFYAPKDTVVIEALDACFQDPGEYAINCTPEVEDFGDAPYWSSYCLSPAAMFSPDVMRNIDRGGWQSPWSLGAGFRSPAMSQALYPSLKTHMLEHHWLQSRRAECNPNYDPGFYEGCEPYYFNMAWESAPAALFYDGHVESVGTRDAQRADLRQQTQTGSYGLWIRDTNLNADNVYFSDLGYDQAHTSYHILTTDGIRGRDIVPD